MVKNQFFKKNKKKLISSLFFAFIPLVAASCTTTNSTSNTELISKKNGDLFSSNFSLKNGVEATLVSNEGSKKYLDELKNQAIFNFYKALGENSDLSIRSGFYKTFLDNQITTINNELTEAKNNVRNSNPINVNAQIQSQLLDPVGGSEFAYKKQKELSFVASDFADLLFSKFFLAVTNNDAVVLPTQTNIDQAIKAVKTGTQNQPKFTFHKDGAFAFKDEKLDNFFANFQQFIFNQWKKAETPFLFNEVSWKFDNDQNALERIYTDNALNKTLSNTTIQASYAFPYFSDQNTNNNRSNVAKFKDFTNTSRNYKNKQNELTIVPKGFSTDANMASVNFTTNTTMIGAFDNSKSLALMNLLDQLFRKKADNFTQKQSLTQSAPATKTQTASKFNLTKKQDFTTSSIYGLDLITSNFVATKDEDLKPNNSAAQAGSRAMHRALSAPMQQQVQVEAIKHLTIKADLAKQILRQIPNQTGRGVQNGNGDIKVIDAFTPSQTNLKDFIFVRTNDGVSAYNIIGSNLIQDSDSIDQVKDKLANVAAYFYFQNRIDNSSGLNFDLPGILKSFYQSNADWLVYKFWETNKDKEGLNLINFAFVANEQHNYLSAVANYIYVSNYLMYKQQFQNNLNDYKNAYASNFGANVIRNGLATLFPYEISTKTLIPFSIDTEITKNKANAFKALETLNLSNPFNNQAQFPSQNIWNNLSEAYKHLLTQFNAAKNSFNTSPLTSNDVSFAYSQYIYTNDYFINQALIAVLGNNQSPLAELAKIKLLESHINSDDKQVIKPISVFESNTDNWISKTNLEIDNLDFTNSGVDKNSINKALKDFYFKNSVDFNKGLVGIDQDKYIFPTETSITSVPSAPSVPRTVTDTNGQTKDFVKVKNTDLSDYYSSNWLSSISLLNTNNTKKYVEYLELILTLKYLFDNNAANFIAEFNTKLDNSSYNYLVFENGINNTINKSITKPQDLLFDKENTIVSVNNNVFNAYETINLKEPNKSSEISNASQNIKQNLFTNLNTATFNNVSGINGFIGLVNTNNNKSNISSELDSALFNFPNQYNNQAKGVLLNLANNKQDLINKIDGYSFNAEVDNVINALLKFYPNNNDLLDALNQTNLDAKKTKLKEVLNKNGSQQNPMMPKIDDLLTPNVGYINDQTLYTGGLGNAFNFGAYILQLQSSNYESLSALKTYIETQYESKKAANNNSPTKEEFAKSVISTLAISFSLESAIKQKAINQIFNNENNKLEVYDQRFSMALGNDVSKTTKQ